MKPERNKTPALRKPPIRPKTVERERISERDPVQVYCRIRPPDSLQEGTCVELVDSRTVKLVPPESSIAFRNGVAKEQSYRFQEVYGFQSIQKEVFDSVAKPLVVDVLNGKNGLLFAYGVTGSGKTYTMLGSSQDGGIVPRTLDVVFNSIHDCQAKKHVFKADKMNGFEIQSEEDAKMDRIRSEAVARVTRARARRDGNSSQDSSQRIPDQSKISCLDEDNMFAIFVSYIEIYNNYIYDLLDDTFEATINKVRQTKILREDENHNMYVHGCNEIEVKTPEEAMEIMQKGQKRRKMAHTKLNMESSRSHSIFTIRVAQAPLDANGESIVADKSVITVSQLSLVDLAGSERTSRTKASGDRLKEAGNINNSLMTLRNCIEVLRENQLTGTNKMVPYRDSRITHYFKNFFDGEGKVRMIVCVNPRPDDYDETLPVMKFAELAAEVQVQRCVATPASHRLIGLTPGRKKANQLFKEVRRRLEEQGEDVKKLDMDLTPIYTLAPSWPPVNFTTETWEDIAQKLKLYLLKRIQSREKLQNTFDEKVLKFGQKVRDMEKEVILLQHDKSSLQGLYDDAMKRIRVLENMVVNAEAANDSMHRKFSDYNELVDNYKQALEERDMAMSQGHLEKQRMKAKLKAKLEIERDRLVKEMNRNLTEQKHSLKNQMYNSQARALKEIFGRNTGNGSSRPQAMWLHLLQLMGIVLKDFQGIFSCQTLHI
ncbi:kinesin family member pavarotti isoform X2 [Oratosquilla oratoria]|uniref:kinesin family member pavarotti isoform X2 n=1 Tax=Oratosquilla oratoria TaxID=337810 RepID=UPI003F7700B8